MGLTGCRYRACLLAASSSLREFEDHLASALVCAKRTGR